MNSQCGDASASRGGHRKVVKSESVCGHPTIEACTCGGCRKVLGNSSQSLQCDRCSKWLCLQCIGLDQSSYRILNRNQKLSEVLMFLCPSCKITLSLFTSIPSDSSASTPVSSISTSVSSVSTSVSSISTSVSSPSTSIASPSTSIAFPSTSIASTSAYVFSAAPVSSTSVSPVSASPGMSVSSHEMLSVSLDEKVRKLEVCLDEMKERYLKCINESSFEMKKVVCESLEHESEARKDRERRKHNVMVFGLEESTPPNRGKDRENVFEILKVLQTPIGVRRLYRIGKPLDGRVRPLLVELDGRWERDLLLSRVKRLACFPLFRRVFVRSDMPVENRKSFKGARAVPALSASCAPVSSLSGSRSPLVSVSSAPPSSSALPHRLSCSVASAVLSAPVMSSLGNASVVSSL